MENTAAPSVSLWRRLAQRMLRFRLRTLLIVVTLVAAASATIGRYYYLEHCRNSAIDAITKAGGQVLNARGMYASPGDPVDRVLLSNVTDQQLIDLAAHMAYLPHLREVDVVGSTVSEDSLAALKSLPNLEVIYVFQTNLTADSLARLEKRLPNILIKNEMPEPVATGLAMRPIYRHALAAMEASSANRFLAAGNGNGELFVWPLNEQGTPNAPVRVREAHSDWLFDIEFSSDGKIMATAGGDRRIMIWETATLDKLYELEGHTDDVHSIVFSPDDQTLVSAGDDMTIRIWDLASQSETHVLTGHSDTIPSLAISPDGTTFASGSRDGDIRLWNLATGELVDVLEGHTEDIHAVDFAPDGTRLLSASYDHTVRVWDLKTSKTELTLQHDDWVFIGRFLGNDRLVSGCRNGKLQLWDAATGRLLAKQNGQGSISRIVPIGAKSLAVASAEGKIQFWDRAMTLPNNTLRLDFAAPPVQ